MPKEYYDKFSFMSDDEGKCSAQTVKGLHSIDPRYPDLEYKCRQQVPLSLSLCHSVILSLCYSLSLSLSLSHTHTHTHTVPRDGEHHGRGGWQHHQRVQGEGRGGVG